MAFVKERLALFLCTLNLYWIVGESERKGWERPHESFELQTACSWLDYERSSVRHGPETS